CARTARVPAARSASSNSLARSSRSAGAWIMACPPLASYRMRLRLLHVDILLTDLDGSAKQRVRILLAVFNGIRKGDPAGTVQVLRVLRIHQRCVMLTNHISQVLRSVDAASLHLDRLCVLLAILLAAESSQVDGPAVRHVAQRPGDARAGWNRLAIAVVECCLERVRFVQVHDADLVQPQL